MWGNENVFGLWLLQQGRGMNAVTMNLELDR